MTRNPESSTTVLPEGLHLSNRDLTPGEKATLRRAASVFFRLALATLAVGTLASAFLIRFVVNILWQTLKPEISGWGWLFAVLIGIALGWGKFQLWIRMLKDIQAGIAVSVRKKDTNGKDRLVKEYLPLSKFHLVNHEEPKDWRAR